MPQSRNELFVTTDQTVPYGIHILSSFGTFDYTELVVELACTAGTIGSAVLQVSPNGTNWFDATPTINVTPGHALAVTDVAFSFARLSINASGNPTTNTFSVRVLGR